MIPLETITLDSAECCSLDIENLGGQIGDVYNGIVNKTYALTEQSTPVQEEIQYNIPDVFLGMGTVILIAWGLNKYFNRLMNGSDFKEFTSN